MWYHRKWALAKVEPRGMARFALSILADHANEKHECWIGLDRLASELGLIDTGTASRHCGKLAEMGIIKISERWRDDGTQSSNLYRLNVTDRELEPFMDPEFDPYKKVRPARLERRRKVREKQETTRAIRHAMEEAGESLGHTPGEGYREGYAMGFGKTVDPRNIAGVAPAEMQGSPLQGRMGHPGDAAGVTPAGLRGHKQPLETSVELPSDETGESSAASAPPNQRSAGGERASGLPAGHGAKAAPRERGTHQGTIDELTAPPLRSDAGTENRQRERETIHSAIAALERIHGVEQAHKVVEMALMAVELAAGDVRDAARAEALEAIRPPRWHNADTARRYESQVDAHALELALSSRPLGSWPSAVAEILGLGAPAA